ncbi:MAG: right-handed parallel beta-helix repeat-containing protein [Patescibacteria group bacterium]
MNKQGGFTIAVLIIILAAIVVGGGVAGYFVFTQADKATIPPSSASTNLPLTETLISTSSPTATETPAPITPPPVIAKPEPTPKTVPTAVPSSTLVSQSGNKKITSCNSITGSGSYTMDKDLNVVGSGCLDIQNINDVAIDCGGHSITLDQLNQPIGTEGQRPLLGFKNVKRFSVTSCNLKVVNPSPMSSTVIFENSSNGTISNTTFYDPSAMSSGLDIFSVTFDHTNEITFSGNTVYGVYQQHYSSGNIVENNIFSPTLKTLRQIQHVVSINDGNRNTIRSNTIDGRWDRSDPSLQVGADLGIHLSDESYATVQENKIKNTWGCSMETKGVIQSSKILRNSLTNSGTGGICGWYYNSWKGNTISDNIVDSSPKLFYLFRLYPLRPGEIAVYFADNVFSGNKFLNPTGESAAVFSFHNSSGGEKGRSSNIPYVVSNNKFSGNDFNSAMRAPLFVPSSMAVDGGVNICGAVAEGDYPNIVDFPLRCISQ